MLSDHERKLLRILFNQTSFHGHRAITLRLLGIKSGFSHGDIMKALTGLERKRYIEWPNHHIPSVKVIEGWERQPSKFITQIKQNEPKKTNTGIWLW